LDSQMGLKNKAREGMSISTWGESQKWCLRCDKKKAGGERINRAKWGLTSESVEVKSS